MRRFSLLMSVAVPTVTLMGLGCAPGDSEPQDETEVLSQNSAALAQGFAPEVEPNGSTATAKPTPKDGVMLANIFDVADNDYFSFTGAVGEKVYTATGTTWSPASTDTIIQLIAPDGTTIIEEDDDNGVLSGTSSTIAGATLTTAGTHYIRVKQFSDGTTIRPYHLHMKTQTGTPAAETEPNDMAPEALPASGWIAGTVSPATDVDIFSLNLNAGDTVFASLDLDPERDGTEFNGQILFGPFNNTFLQSNDGGGTAGPDSEAFFVTVQSAGQYGIAVNSSGGTTSGNYVLSVSVHPATAQGVNCQTYSSAAGAVAIPVGPGQITSTIAVPGNPRIADIDVKLNLTHAAPTDLDITLTSPKGTQTPIVTDIGSATFPDWNFTVDDEAAFTASTFTLLNGTTVQPESASRLDWFDGQEAGGTWTLTVIDDLANNGGSLTGWSMTICEPPALPTCGAGAASNVLNTDFEANDASFTSNGTANTWAYGTPAQAGIFTDCASGTKCFKTNLTGTYSASSVNNLVSPPINLANKQGPILATWAMKYQMDTASSDHLWVEAREVGGANPRRVWEWTGPVMTQSVANPTVTVNAVAGWGQYTADLSSFAGKNIELVFHLDANASTQLAGVGIDDVKVSACPAQVCGNNTIEGTETCDDGNLTNGDGCDSNCTVTACGNNIVTMGETCDDGNTTSGDGCDANCTPTGCGNGIATSGEACDDGNATEGDGCDSNCTVTACGNNIVTMGESCDDGNTTSGDGCDANCTPTGCGNGIVTMGETCDDGNGILGDGCDDGMMGNCTVSACGNGIIAGTEVCDDGNPTDGDGCDSNCTATACGNGVVTLGEMCDDGNGILGDGCDDGMMGNCTTSGCGNGIVAGGEGCDDGNAVDDDGCDSNCTMTGCGNGIVTMGEDCDDGNATSGDGCDNNCTATGCGNGVQTDGEQCDDGNLDEGDGCDTNCTISGCGNGVQDSTEACDDGNTVEGDGCDTNCTATACGNGIQTDGEACDDGNAVEGDGCDTNCTASGCGNNIQDPSEECDDGNTTDGDGCSATCTTEGQGGAGGGGAGGTGGTGGGTGGSGATGPGGSGGGGAGGGIGGGGVAPEGGCGCRVAGDQTESPWAPALAVLGLAMLRLRRRRNAA
ncbi:MAG: DUF4215 domain-containing protein [Polyangiaceae bacterium]|nr:DUF4215 domain-containing protein [Polyangiaceae bacterium]